MTVRRSPTYRLHKPNDRALVEIDGKRHYLGRHDLPETLQAYHAMVGEWIANGYRLPVAPEEITLIEVCDAYLEHCETYYATSDSVPSSSAASFSRG